MNAFIHIITSGAPFLPRLPMAINALTDNVATTDDGLCAFGDGVLGQLSSEEEANSGLDLSGGQRVLLVVTNDWIVSRLHDDLMKALICLVIILVEV